jgi:HD-GYP domain-containing protein (c-di-GMP phosphodiesterase class II)
MNPENIDLFSRLKALNQIGVALSAEKDGIQLQEMILKEAKKIAFADGGTLYIRTDDNQLKFEIMLNESLKIHRGGTSANTVDDMPLLPMYKENGEPNLGIVAVCAAVRGETINIPDAYSNTEFEFSGMREFDQEMHYHSKSFLTVPMKDHDGEIIGVLQLINAKHPLNGTITVFGELEQELVESLASQAAVALANQSLLETQRLLFEGFIELIAKALDEKSPYNGEHCRRVPELTLMLAEAASKIDIGPLKNFKMTEADFYELKVAGLLHDCGKITTPEYVIDKATKLQTIFDRIDLIDTRFEVLKRDAEIALLREQLGDRLDAEALETKLAEQVQSLNEDSEFLHHCNKGGEFMSDELKQRVLAISKRRWKSTIGQEGEQQKNFLSDNEVYNLQITKGTLTPEERETINNHIVATIKMLEALPYPKYLQNVPEYAGGHHERMDGKGYPKGLKREQMSIPARIMGIADVFEALTARNRPYKLPMPLPVALDILGKMKEDNHIDPDLFDVFIHQKVYLHYAKRFLVSEQIQEVDLTKLKGYNPL